MQYTLIQPEEIQMRESRGLVKDIHDNNVRPRQPLSAYRTMLQLIQNNTTLAAAYDIVMETATYRGFDFIRGDKKEREQLRELFDKLNFSQVLPNIIYLHLSACRQFISLCYQEQAIHPLRAPLYNHQWPL